MKMKEIHSVVFSVLGVECKVFAVVVYTNGITECLHFDPYKEHNILETGSVSALR
jgi:hypothetical protein